MFWWTSGPLLARRSLFAGLEGLFDSSRLVCCILHVLVDFRSLVCCILHFFGGLPSLVCCILHFLVDILL